MPSNEAQVRKDLATVEQGLLEMFQMLTEAKAEAAKLQAIAGGLESLCRFIGESLENRSMNSLALELEWHKANDILRAAGRL